MEKPLISYLYCFNHIPISISPLGESAVHVSLQSHPFPVFFRCGLNITLTTDNPLHIHTTQEPLTEEYSIASQMWKLNPTDLCEIARNGIFHSGFSPKEKEELIGPSHGVFDISGHDISKTNVPAIRLMFRLDSYLDEFRFCLSEG